MDATLISKAEAAIGFMPPDEGIALNNAGVEACRAVPGAPLVEIGSYCGKSSIYLGDAARTGQTALFAVDHHRGSEENQAGWEWHDPTLVDPAIDMIDTLPAFRHTIAHAGLEEHVIAVVGDSVTVASHWSTRCALVFIDGGHGQEPAHRDLEMWAPWVSMGGFMAIHDVFPNPEDGGRPPYEIYLRALQGGFEEISATGSLRVLRRVSEHLELL